MIEYFIFFLSFFFLVKWTTQKFISTPVCCPSRSSILTGKYVHNHRWAKLLALPDMQMNEAVVLYRVINNTVTGNCSSRQWQNGDELKTMATYLKANGYTTFYGGKYLNQVKCPPGGMFLQRVLVWKRWGILLDNKTGNHNLMPLGKNEANKEWHQASGAIRSSSMCKGGGGSNFNSSVAPSSVWNRYRSRSTAHRRYRVTNFSFLLVGFLYFF